MGAGGGRIIYKQRPPRRPKFDADRIGKWTQVAS